MKIIITDGIDKKGENILRNAGFELKIEKLSAEALLKEIHLYDAIIVRSATKVTKEVIDAGKNLKIIARGGVGLDNIDVDYAKSKGIVILNTPGASAISVAELTIAHMFAVARFLNLSNIEMREGKWPKKDYSKGFELTGKKLGIIGLGNIGREVAKRAIGLQMDVIAFDPYISSNDLNLQLVKKDQLLQESDIISLHLPKIKGEPPAIGEPELKKVKKGVVIINCARGGVVDEKALLDALNNGTVLAAGLDVFENEPPTEAQLDLIKHPRVSVTPHIGASTIEAQERIGVEIAQKIIEAFRYF